jgi:protein-S-isoprenylcysteine O-methyltransferase Ste14
MIGLGLAWVAWTVRHNRPGNFNILPEARAGARLVQSGPYRWVRHPMYLGSLVLAGGAVVIGPLAVKGGAWLVLLVVLIAKARLEEAALLRQFSDYESYRRERRFLVPGIW